MSLNIVRQTSVLALILLCATVARAQDDDKSRLPFYGFGGTTLTSLLTKPGVQKEIGLDEAESKSLVEALREIDPKNIAFRSAEQRQQSAAIVQATTEKIEAAIQKHLSEQQFQRLQQIEMQGMGGRMLLNDKTADAWELTTEQRERLSAIRKSTDGSGPSDESPSARMERQKNDLLAVLTPDQIKRWREKEGAPFKVPKSFSGPTWRLVLVPEVRKELGLSDDEAATLEQTLTAIQKAGTAESSRLFMDSLPRDATAQRLLSQQTLDTVRSSLTVSQWNRLQELILQQKGIEAIEHHEIAKALGLSQEQQDRIRETIAVYRRPAEGRPPSMTPNELRARREKERADLLDTLTPDQKQQFEAMQGKKVDITSLLRPNFATPRE